MFSVFYTLGFIAACLIGLLIVYGQRKTFPGYQGSGGYGTLIGAALLGLLIVYGISWIPGVEVAVIRDSATIFEFGTKYNSGQLNMGTWLAFTGMAALLAVGTFNVLRYGRVNM